jgi:hypothetical protein
MRRRCRDTRLRRARRLGRGMRYMLVEVPEEITDDFVRIVGHMLPETKIKQVVLDNVEFEDAETVS